MVLDTNCVAAGDIVSIISLTGTEASASFYAFTDDIKTRQESPINFKIARSDITTQQEANWYLLDKIDSLDATTPDVDKSYVDGADQAVQRFAVNADDAILRSSKKYTDDTIDGLIGKIDSLEKLLKGTDK